jgi:putative methionine-R-sulfoxide reductase with GAF domain
MQVNMCNVYLKISVLTTYAIQNGANISEFLCKKIFRVNSFIWIHVYVTSLSVTFTIHLTLNPFLGTRIEAIVLHNVLGLRQTMS